MKVAGRWERVISGDMVERIVKRVRGDKVAALCLLLGFLC